ncbi:MAG: pyridoxamine 5'-phosphate oxidase family protein [Gemmatimonadetes bacterium]|nr:pyridoxamine 5'-phosphate oxidase family protein [Gemmatimonadota bacterium]
MSLDELYAFIRRHRYAVVATVSPDQRPHGATVGIALTDAGDVIFDTLATTQKVATLRANAAIALTIGSLEPNALITVQYEGEAIFPTGAALAETRAAYLRAFPDGEARLSWPGILHTRVRPRRVRYSSFATDPATMHEFRWDIEGRPVPGSHLS